MMRAVVITMFAVLSVACAEQMPADAEPIAADVVEGARAAWQAQGLTAPEHCAAPMWVEVSLEEYRDQCPAPSCADPSVGPTTECSHACTHFLGDGRSVAFFAGTASERSKVVVMSVPEIQAHETWHVWLDCQGDVDMDHTRDDVWKGAAHEMHSFGK